MIVKEEKDLTDQPNGLAIAGFVCSLVGIVSFGWFFPVSITGLVMSSIGVSLGNRGARHRGLAVAGVTLGIIALVIFVVLMGSMIALSSANEPF